MSYVDQLLATNEEIKYEAHQHPFVFFSRIVAETIMLTVLLAAAYFITRTQWEGQGWISLGLGVIALVVLGSGVFDFLRWRNEKFLLTDRRVIHLRGIINKSTMDSSLEKINDVQMRQTFFGRMFNYGDLEVQTANENSDNFFGHIRAPLEFKRAMMNAKVEHDRAPNEYLNSASVVAYQQASAPRMTHQEIEEQLLRLTELRQKNLISDTDFDSKKRDILSRM
ncbi:MAG: PH domain-containing protein [Herpetosiphonaceae bacterium]|nr:PH domain-containing protein [Herpetosiphonaceae bacterium]